MPENTEVTLGSQEPSVADILTRALTPPGYGRRTPETYGPVTLSIQASDMHYSTPREWLDSLDAYEEVEVGFMLDGGGLCRPTKAGIVGFDHLFEEGGSPVAGYVPMDDVRKLRDAVKARYGS